MGRSLVYLSSLPWGDGDVELSFLSPIVPALGNTDFGYPPLYPLPMILNELRSELGSRNLPPSRFYNFCRLTQTIGDVPNNFAHFPN